MIEPREPLAWAECGIHDHGVDIARLRSETSAS